MAAAFVLGEILAAVHLPWYIAAGAVMLWIYTAGISVQGKKFGYFLWLIPAFFAFGFLIYCHACQMPAIDRCFYGTINADFRGQVVQVQKKPKSIALTIRRAGLLYVYDGRQNTCEAGIIVYADPAIAEKTEVGDVVEGNIDLERPDEPSNPGQFDIRSWLRAQGICYTGYCEQMNIAARPVTYSRRLYRLRQKLKQIYSQVLDTENAGTVLSMITGDREMLDADIRDLYRDLGVIHILAISGLHISVVGRSLFRLLRRFGLNNQFSALAASFAVISYYLFTGGSASCLRAVIMFLVSMAAILFGRTYDMLTGMALAAVISFAYYPLQITQVGTQFSYGAVLGIAVVSPVLQKVRMRLHPEEEGRYALKAAHGRDRKKILRKKRAAGLLDRFGSSLAVSMIVFPITAYYYGRIPVIGLLLNLFVLPLASWIVMFGIAVGAAGMAAMPLAEFLAGSVKGLCGILNGLCRFFYQRADAAVYTGSPPVGIILLYYLLLAVFVLRLYKGKNRYIIALMAGLLILFIPFRRMQTLTAFLDVGQGACVFLRSDSGTTWMIDGGSSTEKEVARYRLIPFLHYYGESAVDYAVVTHGDSDHYSGIQEMIKEGAVRHLVISTAAQTDEDLQQLSALAGENGIDVMQICAGRQWQDGTWQFHCLSPVRGASYEDKNDASIVLRLDTGGCRFLFPGDISEKTEKRLAAADIAGIDVLYAAHHGSRYGTGEHFLKAAQPKSAIISCGLHNHYGHPAKETLRRLKEAGCMIYRTDRQGEIEVSVRNGEIIARAYRRTGSR